MTIVSVDTATIASKSSGLVLVSSKQSDNRMDQTIIGRATTPVADFRGFGWFVMLAWPILQPTRHAELTEKE
jgi:hypothetical protein